MPVQNPELAFGQRRKRRLAPLRRQPDQAPADLLLAIGIDARAQHGRDRLRAQANTDCRRAALEHGLDHAELLFEEGVTVDLIDADGPAEHDQLLGVLGDVEVVNAGLDIGETDTAIGKDAGKGAGVLEGDVTNGDCGLHSSAFFMVLNRYYHAGAARVPGSFDAAVAMAAGGMHAAEKQIPLGPDMGVRRRAGERLLLGIGKPCLETECAAFLDMQARRLDGFGEAHAPVEHANYARQVAELFLGDEMGERGN